MISAPFLTSIYLSVLYPVLCDWVAIDDFVVLDTAMCNKKNREFFILQVTSENFTHCGNIQYNRQDYIDWLCMKGVRVKNINISRCTEKKMDKNIMVYFGKLKFIERIETKFCSNLFRLLDEFKGLISGIVLMDSFDLKDEDLVTISLHPKLSQISSITILECDITSEGLKNFNAIAMPNLNFVEIYYCDQLTSSWVVNLATQYTTCLKHLISDKADDEAMFRLAELCPNLETLNVNQSSVTGAGVLRVVESCPKLTWLDIESILEVTDAVVAAIAEHCPALKILHLSYCTDVTDWSVLKLAESCKNLTNVSFNSCELLTDLSLSALFKACPLLQVADLNRCSLLTDRCVQIAATHCPRIESFDIGATKVTEAVLPLFVPEGMEVFRLVQVEHYHGPNCTCGAVGANHEGLGMNLEDIPEEIEGEEGDNEDEEVNGDLPAGAAFDAAVQAINTLANSVAVQNHAGMTQALQGLTDAVQALQVVDQEEEEDNDEEDEWEDEEDEDEEDDEGEGDWESVDGSDDEEDDEDGEDDDDDGGDDGSDGEANEDDGRFAPDEDLSLTFTITHSGNKERDKYRSLVVREPDFEVSEEGLRAVLLGAGRTLQVLSVHFGHLSITDDTVRAVTEGCPRLHSVSLTECNVSADAWLRVAQRYGEQLQMLGCDGCLSMNDQNLSVILSHTPNLHTLSMRGCSQLTDTGIMSVVKLAPKLVKLDAAVCKLITNASILALIRVFRSQLQHLSLDYCSLNSRIFNEISCQCEAIRYVSVKGCKDMLDTGECVPRMAQACPTLVTLICDDGVYRFTP